MHPHPSRPGARRATVWTVGARMGEVRALSRRLRQDGIEFVTLESTSDYWRIWFAERWVGSARRECLDLMLIADERHLWLVLGEYTDHYYGHRPHRSLPQDPPAGRLHPPVEMSNMRVLRRDRLGGLIREYTQVA